MASGRENTGKEVKDLPEIKADEIYETRLMSHEKKGHYFEPTSKANEVKCKCGVGYIITPNMWFHEGHIYLGQDLVI